MLSQEYGGGPNEPSSCGSPGSGGGLNSVIAPVKGGGGGKGKKDWTDAKENVKVKARGGTVVEDNRPAFANFFHRKKNNICLDLSVPIRWVGGIFNLGDTYYMNSSFQLMFALPVFAVDLQKHPAAITTAVAHPCANSAPLTYALVALATRGAEENISIVKEIMVTAVAQFRGDGQQDAHQLTTGLLEIIHNEILGYGVAGPVMVTPPGIGFFHPAATRNFYAEVKVLRVCKNCN